MVDTFTTELPRSSFESVVDDEDVITDSPDWCYFSQEGKSTLRYCPASLCSNSRVFPVHKPF